LEKKGIFIWFTKKVYLSFNFYLKTGRRRFISWFAHFFNFNLLIKEKMKKFKYRFFLYLVRVLWSISLTNYYILLYKMFLSNIVFALRTNVWLLILTRTIYTFTSSASCVSYGCIINFNYWQYKSWTKLERKKYLI
jgi:hypothetical protein